MSRNDYYTTEIVLDYLFYQNYYKLNGIDLLRQENRFINQNGII